MTLYVFTIIHVENYFQLKNICSETLVVNMATRKNVIYHATYHLQGISDSCEVQATLTSWLCQIVHLPQVNIRHHVSKICNLKK